MKRRPIALLILIPTLFLAFAVFPAVVRFVTDWYWFNAIGYRTVFTTSLLSRFGLGLGVGLVAFAFFYVNLRVAQRGVVPDPVVVRVRGQPNIDLTGILRRLSWPVALFFALVLGAGANGNWLTVLRFLHRTAFGQTDPIFGRDVGYYVFTLPAISWALGLVSAFAVVGLIITVPLYVFRGDIVVRGRRPNVEPSAGRHLAALVALWFGAAAATVFFVRIPSLLYSETGPLFGASYTDLAIRLPALRILGVAAVIATGFVAWGAQSGKLIRNGIIALVVYAGTSIAGGLVAGGVQSFVVKPNELVRETPQLEHHIHATRRAWGIDEVSVRDLSGEATLSLADLQSNTGTVTNIRLWDREPLLQTFRQLQEIRTYYDFRSVDDDRYWIDGEYRQVLLSPRELSTASLPQRNFINDHLQYTHGMGLTLSPVNQVTVEGLPVLLLKDLPPRSTVSLEVTRPGIYYGELANDFVVVNTEQDEFDYPLGDTNAVTVYDGTGGVRVSSLFRKLLMSVRFASFDMAFTTLITRDSRIMYYRNIRERAAKALPFLRWDADPYIVVDAAGRLKWILDAYTSTNRYPYSVRTADGTNYMRNSVKVVIDAYDGDVKAYIADPDDPIVQTYADIFPGIFQSIDQMPQDLRAHVRFPSDLFSIQTALYATYHMSEPDVFYAREDQWEIPSLSPSDRTRDPFLRHMVMRLPGETEDEYIVMTPFTPRGKDNLAAWVVARCDGEHFGQLVAYRFPRQSLVFGPSQIVNRINQNTDVSQQVSLWDQRGSQVIRGNLLVIPINESLMFVQALYLRAEGGQIPELKRVIVAYQNQVVMEETLAQGITRLFGGSLETGGPPRAATAAAADAPPAAGAPVSLADLVRQASDHYDQALAAQRAGDWTRYGDELRRMGDILRQLRERTGGAGQN